MRDRQSERGLQVDNQVEPSRLLDRQIGGLGALQDLVDERGSTLEILLEHLPVGQQTAGLDKLAPLVNRRQPVLRCEREYPGLLLEYWGTRFHQNCLVVVGGTGGESPVDFSRFADQSPGDPQAERARQGVDGGRANSAPRQPSIGQKRNPRRRRDQLMQQLDALAVELPAKVDDPGDIAAGVREAVGETSFDNIPSGDHDDRHGPRLIMHRQRIGNSAGDDDIRICRDQLDGGGLASLRIPAGYSALDAEVTSLDPAELRHRPVKKAARVRLVGDDKPDMGALRYFLGAGASAGRGPREDEKRRRAQFEQASVVKMPAPVLYLHYPPRRSARHMRV